MTHKCVYILDRQSIPEGNSITIPSFYPKRHKDKKTAYVIGTGPSLKKIDMAKLKDKTTMTFNRAYVAFEDWGFHPTYYLCIDQEDIKSIGKDVSKMVEEKKINHFFFPHQFNIGHGNKNVTQLQDVPEPWMTFGVLSDYLYISDYNLMITGLIPNAGIMGMKMFYLMGYSEVVLLGCDARYRTDPESQRSISWDDDGCVSHENYDPNHFRDDYFGKGQRFGKPIEEKQMMRQWTQAKYEIDRIPYQIYQASGMTEKEFFDSFLPEEYDFKVYSCSEGSALNDMFPYIPFEDFLNGKRE